MLVAALIRVAVMLAVLLPVAVNAQTLEAIRSRGYLVCGATGALPGFASQFIQQVEGREPVAIWTGFDVDICRAVAAAIFGDPGRVDFRALRGTARFAQLQTGEIDIITRNGPWTMHRDTSFGVTYVATTFVDGQTFMVPQASGIVSAYELEGLSICAVEGSEELARMREFFALNGASNGEVLYEDLEDLAIAYDRGVCNAVSAPARWLHAMRRSLPTPAAHRILPERISKEMLGPVIRSGDERWAKIVRWTIFALINAEELGISSVNVDSLGMVRNPAIRRLIGMEKDYGASLGLQRDFMADVIRAVGNYGEIFERNFGAATGAELVRGQNSLWGNGGLLFAPPIQ